MRRPESGKTGEDSISSPFSYSSPVTLITAPLVLPITTPPLREGALVLSKKGMILDCGPWREVRARFPKVPEQRYEAVLVPGFINTHCHLELSHLRGQLRPGGGLPSFVRQVMELRNVDPQRIEQGIQEALQELRQEGVVGLVDIGNTGRSLPFFRESGLRGLFLLELIKFDPQAAERIFKEGKAFLNREKIQKTRDLETQGPGEGVTRRPGEIGDIIPQENLLAFRTQITTGLTGHAIYSCSEPLLQKVAAYALETRTPLSLHLLENPEERMLIEEGRGFFADYLRQLGYSLDNWRPPKISSVFYAERCLGFENRRLYVHLIYIREDELQHLATQPNTFIALCPKSNLFVEGRLPPIDQMAAIHPNITLGTDSLASNDRLSILDELKTIQHAFPHLSSAILIQWATLNGARYLGLEKILGSLTPGLFPGILAIFTPQRNPENFLAVEDLSLKIITPETQ